MSWIFFTVIAAFMQAWRNAFQKRLSEHVNAFGTTLARFIGGAPLALVYLLLVYACGEPTTTRFSAWFWFYCAAAAVMQIAATVFMVKLFQQKNYAIGVGLAKSEAIIAAVIGSALLGDVFSVYGWLGIVIGTVAVFLLSGGTRLAGLSWLSLGTGIASGFCFAVTSLLVREASLELTTQPFLHRAAWVLLVVISMQALVMTAWLYAAQPDTLRTLWRQRRLTLAVSFSSFLGSWGWFNAMALASVALVKTLGQIEVLFTLLISWLVIKERLSRNEFAGLLLVVLGAILVIWA